MERARRAEALALLALEPEAVMWAAVAAVAGEAAEAEAGEAEVLWVRAAELTVAESAATWPAHVGRQVGPH